MTLFWTILALERQRERGSEGEKGGGKILNYERKEKGERVGW